MGWRHSPNPAGAVQHDVNRDLTRLIPFLLAPELAGTDWPDRHAWDVEYADARGQKQLLAWATRTDRILITPDTGFLDDTVFPPAQCPGLVVVNRTADRNLDACLVTLVSLLGPFRSLYHGVKVHADETGGITITAPAGKARRITRRFLLDRDGVPALAELHCTDGLIHGSSGYRRFSVRPEAVL